MSCADFVARLQTLLDQHRDPQRDATLLSHASRCDACRERLEAQEQLFMFLAAAAGPRGHVNSNARPAPVGANQQTGAADERPRRLRRLVLCSLAASAALLGVMAWYWPAPARGPTVVAQHATRPLAAPALAAAQPRATGTAPVVAARSAFVEDAARRAETVSAEAPQPVPDVAETAVSSLADRWSWGSLGLPAETTRISYYYHTICTAPPIPNQSVPQVEQLAEEILPLAQPFVSVLNVLRRTLPGHGSPPLPPGDGGAAVGMARDRWV